MTVSTPSKGSLHLSIDPGSRRMGVAVFSEDGKFIVSKGFSADRSITSARRLWIIRKQFVKWFKENFEGQRVTATIMERLPPKQLAPTLPISPGVIVAHPDNHSSLNPESWIGVQRWKAFVRMVGKSALKNPKGIPALEDIGWSYKMPACEDEADAILLYLTYTWDIKGYAYLGPTHKIKRDK